MGAEGCDCTPNGGCDPNLICASRKCVEDLGTGGATSSNGGSPTSGGAQGTGGTNTGSGGTASGNGGTASGGATSTGGGPATGGGGSAATGGATATGGAAATGGTVSTGGATATGGSTGVTTISTGCSTCYNQGATCGDNVNGCTGNATCNTCLSAPTGVSCASNSQFTSLGSCACTACPSQCAAECASIW